MAVRFNREQVIYKIFNETDVETSDTESEDEAEKEVDKELDREKEKLEACLSIFEGGGGFNAKLFQEKSLEVLMPIVRLSSQDLKGMYLIF